MTNKVTKKRYNPLLTGRRNYFDDGGFWANPFKSMDAKKAVASAAGAAVGLIGGSLIGGGLLSGAGNVLQGLSGVAAAIPGPWGAVASAGLGLLGGLTNRMFGSKMNTENIAKVESNINTLNSFLSGALSFDELSLNWANAATGMQFSDKFIGTDGWFSNKASKKANELRKKVQEGNAWVSNSLLNNANNVNLSQQQDLLANYAAFGGELNTQGGDFTNGLIYVDEGGTHESNPYEGVMMGVDPEGTPNLVEEGEVVFNDYVFSNRMNVPKAIRNKYKLRGTKPLTYADAAKQMAKESEERPNDPISLNGLEAGLYALMSSQEQERMSSMPNKFAYGGGMGNHFAGPGDTPNTLKFKDDPALFISNLLGFKTKDEYDAWVRENNIGTKINDLVRRPDLYLNDVLPYIKVANPALGHAISQGYNPFSEATPTTPTSLTFDFKHGGWGSEGYSAWKDSTDAAWLEATRGYTGNGSDFNVAERLMATDAYRRGTEWLQESEGNRLLYLQSIVNSPDAPLAAKNHALKFITEDGQWREGAARDYNTIYGTVRTTHPGTFWKTPDEMLRLARAMNYSDNGDGTFTLLYDTDGYESIGSPYSWSDASNDYTVNYYKKKADSSGVASTPGATKWQLRKLDGTILDLTEDLYILYAGNPNAYQDLGNNYTYQNGDRLFTVSEIGKPDTPPVSNWMMYAPIVGSALGVGMSLFEKPDESQADAVLEASKSALGNYKPVSWRPIGDYLTYRPLDRDYYLNALNAQAGATRRNVLNTSGGNRGTAMAGLLAADYNSINGTGDALMKMDMYNREQEQKVADFNRTTNITNSEGFLKANMANQSTAAQMADISFRGGVTAAQLRLAERQRIKNDLAQNLTGLFDNAGALGKQIVTNQQVNWYNKYGGAAPEKRTGYAAYGGKIKRRKGLTY